MLDADWGFRTHQILGDHMTAFVGPESTTEKADLQLHVVVQHFNITPSEGIHRLYLLQYILKSWVDPALEIQNGQLTFAGLTLTTTQMRHHAHSTTFHVGLFIDPEQLGKPSIGLDELDVACKPLAFDVMHAYRHNIAEIVRTTTTSLSPQVTLA